MTLVMLLLYVHAAVAYSVVEVINTVAACKWFCLSYDIAEASDTPKTYIAYDVIEVSDTA